MPSRLPWRSALTFTLLLGCLEFGARPAGAAPEVAIQLEGPSIRHLTVDGTEIIGSGVPILEKVVLRSLDGKPTPGSTTSIKDSYEASGLVRRYTWGATETRFETKPNRVDLTIKVENYSASILDGLQFEVATLNFPQPPRGWVQDYAYLSTASGAPGINIADFGSGSVAVVNEDFDRPLLTGFPGGPDLRKRPVKIVAGSIGWFPPQFDSVLKRPIYPGGRDTYHISFRVGASGSSIRDLAGDVLDRFAAAYPPTLKWTDRRPIGALHLSTSEATHHSPNNPRGWFLDPQGVDVNTNEGKEKFRQRLLTYADESIKVLQDINAQGMIVWDLEGQEYPHATSYIGDPRSLPAEMESYADEFFARFKAAGLKVGMCLRPQLPVRGAYGTPVRQIDLADPVPNLLEKIAYAKKRWGASIFYIDSNGDPNFPLPAEDFQRLTQANPDVLLIPEHETARYWAYTAPYHELRLGVTGTPPLPRLLYPDAFSVVYVPDGPVEEKRAELVAAVKAGDILLFRGWWPDSFNAQVKEIYAAAGK